MKLLSKLLLFFLFVALLSCNNGVNEFKISESSIYVDSKSAELVKWAANDLADDIKSITGKRPEIIYTDEVTDNLKGIYIGSADSKIADAFRTETLKVKGKWEGFNLTIKDGTLLIIGSDTRGTVYGIFDLAERMGISPWKWWADVSLVKKSEIAIELPEEGIVSSPSVQYRGIFLNDEDWGLQPWAAKTFEPETGDIGPKTYEKIFQLLLRLKANTIWPAMHPSTAPFFMVEGNKEMAAKYHIVIGTSHAEPMLRNNVREWKKEERGEFNYFENSENVKEYWQERVSEIQKIGNECLFSIGMRGVHDSKMEGASSKEEMVEMISQIIIDQREMLASTFNKPADEIPQVLVPYKEVLELYNKGLKVPEDVTLMWCDDNYGYIRRLSTAEEQKRKGGAGVYYHLSYWGRPHDYLWLSTTQPGLIWYEMTRAYQNGANKIWIANVGDIKPAEYNMEFFLDLAWDINGVNASTIKDHMTAFYTREFGSENGAVLADIMDEYYRLACIRKPEFMGWSQTEPSTKTRQSDFNQFANGNEVQRRIDSYQKLLDQVNLCKKSVSDDLQDGFFQLVEYPVKGAAYMNFKFMNAQLAYNATDDKNECNFSYEASKAYDSIASLTDKFNNGISNGKWNHMMDAKPRGLAAYQMPEYQMNQPKVDVQLIDGVNDKSVFIQAKDFVASKGVDSYTWEPIDELGYSNSAITLYPFYQCNFNDEKPFVEYRFDVAETGDCEIEVRCLPTHSNNFDHKLSVSVDKGEEKEFSLNTVGRSKEWKENVLRNYQSVKYLVDVKEAGKHVLKISVNQTGIMIDQIAINPEGCADYYEISVGD